MLKKWITFLLYGGASKLNSFEKWILHTAAINAEPDLSQLIQKQTDNITYLQRNNNNRIILLTVSETVERIEPLGDSDGVCVAKIAFNFRKKRHKSQIYTIQGKLRTIESNKPLPNDIVSEELAFESIEFFPQNQIDFARMIDQQEHKD